MGLTTEVYTIIAAIAGVLSVKVFDIVFDKSRRHDDRLHENTIAITTLQIEIKHLNEKLAEFTRLRQDVDQAHHSIRDLRKRVDANDIT